MLETLRIKNLALVDDLTLDLRPGFNAITGETGAGKSILIGALSLVLGDRAERTLIRSECDQCGVEAVFGIENIKAPLETLLVENGLEPCEDQQLIIKRVFTRNGSNRQFVNGSPTTLATLGCLGEWLVDIHGPHDHQSLLHVNRQLEILDAYGNLTDLRKKFASVLQQINAIEERKSALIVDDQTYARQLDLLRFQVQEISGTELSEQEEADLEKEYHRASNAAQLTELSQAAANLIDGEDPSILTQVGALGRLLQQLAQYDSGAEPLAQAQEQIVQSLNELQSELSRYLDRIELDPHQLRELETRLNLIQSLKRKYGTTLRDVIAFGENAAEKLRELEQRDDEIAEINAQLEELEEELWRIGSDLSRKRRKVIPKLCQAVEKELADLGFQQSRFDIHVESRKRDSAGGSGSGIDRIAFQFSPNPGEPLKPLRSIASSGEIARVMLALKTVLAVQDKIPVLIFDEVDANVGGETAAVVGEKMNRIGEKRQVLCVTHLAPVAAAAQTHFVVSKEIKSQRTLTRVRRLTAKDRVPELARMLGGQGAAQKKHAEALLKESR